MSCWSQRWIWVRKGKSLYTSLPKNSIFTLYGCLQKKMPPFYRNDTASSKMKQITLPNPFEFPLFKIFLRKESIIGLSVLREKMLPKQKTGVCPPWFFVLIPMVISLDAILVRCSRVTSMMFSERIGWKQVENSPPPMTKSTIF